MAEIWPRYDQSPRLPPGAAVCGEGDVTECDGLVQVIAVVVVVVVVIAAVIVVAPSNTAPPS